MALAEEKQFAEALASFREAVRCQPHFAEAHCALGNTFGELGRDEGAVAAYHEAIRHKPDFVDALHNLGVALTRLRRGPEAAIFLGQAVRLKPDFAEGHNNLGLAYTEAGDFTAAQASFEQALRLNPGSVNAHTNLGSAFKEQGRPAEALACYQLALALEPGCATTHWNRSLAWLQMGNFEQGWPEYEWRWRRKEAAPRHFPHPLWDGAPLKGRTIFLYAEQGLGDMLQFIRYAPLVKERGGRVVVGAPLPVARLFASCSGIDQLVTENQPVPPFEVQAPFLSLPHLLGTTLATVPAQVPYLTPEPELVERWRERLGGVTGLRVGIAWQGNPRHKWDRYRSFPVELLAPLARIKGVSLVSLQKEAGREQLVDQPFEVDGVGAKASMVAEPVRLGSLTYGAVVDLGPELNDFADTAAVMKCLDLVISCDTAVAHLAGALGVPVWVVLATVSDWRWLLKRADSPWYPSMRLFRQERLGKWRPVFGQMAGKLRRLARETGVSRRSVPKREFGNE